MTRAEAIEILKKLIEAMQGHVTVLPTPERIAAIRLAIASLETDEAYQLEYERTTKNDLALIHTEGLDEGIRCAMCTNSMANDRGCDGACVVNTGMYKKVMDVIENHIADTDKMTGSTTKNDLGVDLISRKEVIEQCQEWRNHEFVKMTNPYYYLEKRLNNLPSVTPQEPKTGHWIPTYGNVECSVCGSVKDSREVGKATHYCDFCGARMIEPQESEDKE